jgi:hypothetical protein
MEWTPAAARSLIRLVCSLITDRGIEQRKGARMADLLMTLIHSYEFCDTDAS